MVRSFFLRILLRKKILPGFSEIVAFISFVVALFIFLCVPFKTNSVSIS
tara:strand:+ start:890 stop:1036 length:147 start_codon:yes stop_codon:yes gene_type:complete